MRKKIPLETGENEKHNRIINVSVLYNSKLSDPKVIIQIQQHIERDNPFGLKCESSTIVFIPKEFTSYWISNSDSKQQQRLIFPDMEKFLQCVALQYLTHKEFIPIQSLLHLLPQKQFPRFREF